MTRYISLIRAINVGGHAQVNKTELISIYEALGFQGVKTYLQSGNVIFDAAEGEKEGLINSIQESLARKTGASPSVLLRTPDEMKRVIENNPFTKTAGTDTGKLYVTFLSKTPEIALLKKAAAIHDESDRFVIHGEEIYIYCENGYGRSRFSNNFFEKNLKVIATTRNWRTTTALLDIARSDG